MKAIATIQILETGLASQANLNKPGNEGYFFGQGAAGDDDVVVFASIWNDLQSVKDHFGEEWQSSYLPPGYEDLISKCSVRHFDLRSGWHVKLDG